jgi:hypothetical protein
MIARNHLGLVLSGCCMRYRNIQDPFTIELVACRDAMALARSKRVDKLILETNCQVIVNTWNDDRANRSVGCYLFEETKEMEGFFQGFKLLYTRREANSVAHLCAREAISLNMDVLNFDVSPAFLTEVVQSELVSPV